MKTELDLNKMTCIINIQEMRRKIGISVPSTKYLLTKSYDWLHEEQNSTIEHYNQALKNSK